CACLCVFLSILCVRHMFVFFFFFSSRRRHTRLQGDWSSDVCSSDLRVNRTGLSISAESSTKPYVGSSRWISLASTSWQSNSKARSEERRVGKECRSRGSAYD